MRAPKQARGSRASCTLGPQWLLLGAYPGAAHMKHLDANERGSIDAENRLQNISSKPRGAGQKGQEEGEGSVCLAVTVTWISLNQAGTDSTTCR